MKSIDKNDSDEVRTAVTAVKGRCLNRLTMGPGTGRFEIARFQFILAPQVGLEPTTSRLTAVRSTIELLRNVPCRLSFVPSKPNTDFQIYTIFIHFGQALDLLVHIS